ncbi:hypothetical protein [Oceanicaulis sp. MMSF_3324]|uniref:hypothetical protein n=1 Tax=Oceanicaulis sp. MMSF_3324 TaxID=3046702 RepID=UPI00273DF92B|nr:hypothetical protein [Oceanicaulis sp. MMSF_3324]
MANLLMAGGAIVTGVGGYYRSRAEAAALEADGREARRVAESEARARSRESRAAIGRGIVTAGASGATIEGSALDVLARMEAEGDAHARRARYEGRRRQDALNNQAASTRAQGTITLVSSLLAATGTALSGGGSSGAGAEGMKIQAGASKAASAGG